MIEKEIYKSGSFTDWLGEEHPFVVAGVIATIDDELVLADRVDGLLIPVLENDGDRHVQKVLFIGVSICNPRDIKEGRYKEEIGQKIAYNKAISLKLAQRWFATNVPGMLTDKLAECIVDQEVNFVTAHPEKFIKGYLEAKAQYERKQRTKNEFENLSIPEHAIVRTTAEKKVNLYKLAKIANILGNDVPPSKMHIIKQEVSED